jgi:hypothetical protein
MMRFSTVVEFGERKESLEAEPGICEGGVKCGQKLLYV